MAAQYTSLIFIVPSTVDIHKFRYDLVIQYKSGEATYQRTTGTKTKRYIDQKFNNQGKTIERQLPKGDIQKINYHIKVNGQLVKNISAKPNKSKGVFRKYELKTTIAGTKKDPNTIKKVLVDTTEVAWYLVKKQETVESFLKRIYRYRPTQKEENIFRTNNSHLTGTPVLTLLPGDIVVLSNTSNSNSKELTEMKRDAKAAKVEFEKAKKEFKFDAESFAYNADALQGMLMQADYVALTKNPIKSLDKPSGGIDYGTLAAGLAGTSQGIVTFYENSNELVQKSYAKIYEAMEYEKSLRPNGPNGPKGSKLAHPKNYKLFKQKYVKLFKDYDHKLSQEFFKFETGIQTNNLRRQINKDVFARSKNYKGGISAYTDNLRNMGKISRFTYLGGNVLVGIAGAQAYMNIEAARKTGDSDHITKTTITETLKFGGGVYGGYYGAMAGTAILAVAFGVSTGGLGFVVLGAGAVIGGTIGGLAGGEAGNLIADEINERI